MFFVLPSVSAQMIGYEYIHNNETVMAWNNYTYDYFMDNDCLQGLSNVENETWENLSYRIGYTSDNGSVVYGLPFENCTRRDFTDNLTYVNLTARNSIEQSNRKLIFGLYNYLELNDQIMSQTYGFKLNQSVNKDVWFNIRISDIRIGNDSENDYFIYKNVSTNQTRSIDLNNVSSVIWLNSSDMEEMFFLVDIVQDKNILRAWPNITYSWMLRIGLTGNINLFFNLGSFTAQDLKLLPMYWVDAAKCTCFGGGTIHSGCDVNPDNGSIIYVNDSFELGCTASYHGFGSCTGCGVFFWHNQYGDLFKIPQDPNATDVLDCHREASYCFVGASYPDYEYENVTCYRHWPTLLGYRCRHEDAAGWDELWSGAQYNYCFVEEPSGLDVVVSPVFNRPRKKLDWVAFVFLWAFVVGGLVLLRYLGKRKSKVMKV